MAIQGKYTNFTGTKFLLPFQSNSIDFEHGQIADVTKGKMIVTWQISKKTKTVFKKMPLSYGSI